MMTMNWGAILILSVATCAFGSVWFGPPLFGKIWMKIHHGEKRFTPEEMKIAMTGMWKLVLAEFAATFLMIAALDYLMGTLHAFDGIFAAVFVWLGFVLPTQISATVWGNDAKKWMPAKIAIAASYRLLVLLVSGYVLSAHSLSVWY